jgi:hypothetical protein
MTRGVKLATLGASPFALAACAAHDCQLDHDANIKDSLEANRAPARRRAQSMAQALRGLGGPLAGSAAVVAADSATLRSWSRRTEPTKGDLNGAPRAGSGGTGPARNSLPGE